MDGYVIKKKEVSSYVRFSEKKLLVLFLFLLTAFVNPCCVKKETKTVE